ncbi:MAG: hypothetical protein RL754_1435 [Bacteroidota bacterium]
MKNWTQHLRSPYSFYGFMGRFLLTYVALLALYQLYLAYTSYTHNLDWITYGVSELAYLLAKSLGVANCTFSCFIDGCYIGREGKLINVVEGCNGLKLAIAYGAFIIGYSGINKRTLLQLLFGLLVIQGFNVLRIGILVVLRDLGGDAYFYFIKYLFGSIIYGAIIALWGLQPSFNRYLQRS